MKLKIVTDATCHRTNFYKGKSVGAAHYYNSETGELLREAHFELGELTPYAAERQTVIRALDNACEMTRGEVEVWTDAEHIVRHMSGDYLLTKQSSKDFFDKLKQIELRYKCVKYFHNPRKTKSAQAVHLTAARAYSSSYT